MSKSVRLSEEAYERLAAHKREDETVSDVVLRLVEAVVSSKPIEPAGAGIMQRAGRRAGELATDGQPIPDGDVIVAATAESIDEPVLARDVDHFERLDVFVETY